MDNFRLKSKINDSENRDFLGQYANVFLSQKNRLKERLY